MVEIKNFDNWVINAGASEGSGRSEKVWLRNPNTEHLGLFKFPKCRNRKNNDYTPNSSEFASEHLAYKIAQRLGIRCAKIDLGCRDGRLGCMSYKFLTKREHLIHGIDIITMSYPNFDVNKLVDRDSGEYYCFDMIVASFRKVCTDEEMNIVISSLIIMMIFDMLIGNTDRHQQNWGIISSDDKRITFSYLYDNGSSLCAYITEDSIAQYLGKDKQKFMSLVDSKSHSRIRVDGKSKKEPSHSEIMAFLADKYPKQSRHLVNRISNLITEKWLRDVLDRYPEYALSENKKMLILKFVMKKIEIMESIFNCKEV